MAASSILAGMIKDGRLIWSRFRVQRERLLHDKDGAIDLVCRAGSDEQPEETPDAMAARVKQEASGLSRSPLIIGLDSENLLLRVLHLPQIEDPVERASMVRLQVDKISPFPADASVVSHEILALREDSAVILAAAVQLDVANTIADMLAPAGLTPVRLDAEIMGWYRVLREAGHIPESGRHLLMIAAGGAPRLIMVQDGCPFLFRVTASLAGLSEEEQIEELAGELTQTLMSVELEHGSMKTCLHVWHDGSLPQGWVAKVAEESRCEVREAPLDDLSPVLEGLARRGCEQDVLDLTPSSWHDVEREQQFRNLLLRWAAGLVVVWLLAIAGITGGVTLEQYRLRRLQEEKARWSPQAMQVRQMRRRVNTIKRYMDVRYSALECLREISRMQPSGVDLTSFNYRKNENIRLTGEAPQVDVIYDLKNRIDSSELFGESALQGPRWDGRKRMQSFEIIIALPGGEL